VKQRCEGPCATRPSFRVLLRDLSEGVDFAEQEVCGRHVAWSVRVMEQTAVTLRKIRAGRNRTFKEEVVVSTLKSSRQEGGTDG
jgi:hypothetical protein